MLGQIFHIVSPTALVFMMLAMGLGLTKADFERLFLEPRLTAAGLGGQVILLPLIGFLGAWFLRDRPELAVGLVILAVCPGGAMSNAITYTAKGNIALSLTLTLVTSVLALLTIPALINLAIHLFMGMSSDLHLPYIDTLKRFGMYVILPVTVGLVVRALFPEFVYRTRKLVRQISIGMFAALLLVFILYRWRHIADNIALVTPITLILASVTVGLGHGLGAVFGLSQRDRYTVAVEVGIQNIALASLIAVNLLKAPELGLLAFTYAITSLIPIVIYSAFYARPREWAASDEAALERERAGGQPIVQTTDAGRM